MHDHHGTPALPPGRGIEPHHANGAHGHGIADLQDLAAGLRNRWWLILGLMVAGMGAAFLLVKRETPMYVGAALIRLVDERSVLTGTLGDPSVAGSYAKTSEWIQSQLLVLQSRGVAGQVVDREGMRLTSATPGIPRGRLEDVHVELPPEQTGSVVVTFREHDVIAAFGDRQVSARYGEVLDLGQIRFRVAGRPELSTARLDVVARERAIDDVAAGFSAWSRAGTDAIEVRYTSLDRRLAERLVNAFVLAFRDENARAAQEQAARRRAFLEEQLQQNDAELRSAQTALIAFRSERKLYSSAERIAAEQSTLVELETRRQELDSDRRLFSSLLARARAAEGSQRDRLLESLASAPGLEGSAQIAQLRSELLTHGAALGELEVQFTDLHPQVRRARALRQQVQERLMTAVQMHIATMEARVAALDDLRDRATARLAPLPAAEAEEWRLVQDVESARTLGEQLRGEYQRARTTEAVEAGQVAIVNLAAGASTGNRHPWLKLAIGGVIGLVLGGALTLLLELLNNSVRKQKELAMLLHVPDLGVIPSSALHDRQHGRRRLRAARNGRKVVGNGQVLTPAGTRALITSTRSNSVGSEAYRTLRTTLLFSDVIKGLKTMAVTSACIGDGKTTVAANLAVSFAQQGHRVLLIDADLRRPRIHELFNQPRQPGLADLLLQTAEPAAAYRSTSVENLTLLLSGTTPSHPAELVGGARMKQLLQSLAQEYDLVLIDAPPVLGAADPIVLAAHVDGVLFLVRAGATDRDAAQYAVRQLERVGARVLGVVLNDPDAVAARYGHAYSYAYADV